MRVQAKHRPSVSTNDLRLASNALYESILQRLGTKDANTSEVSAMISLKAYFDSFTAPTEEELMLAKYKAQAEAKFSSLNGGAGNQQTQTIQATQAAQQSDPFLSVIDHPDLTDEQKYDMLKTRDSSTYTDAEQAFFLNAGTMIELRRMSRKPIGETDL